MNLLLDTSFGAALRLNVREPAMTVLWTVDWRRNPRHPSKTRT